MLRKLILCSILTGETARDSPALAVDGVAGNCYSVVVIETPVLHVVLHEPEIPPNTGNAGRTCSAVGAKLWLVRPLGFRIDAHHLRRAGMDYWDELDWQAVDNWQELLTKLPASRFWYFSKTATRCVWEADFRRGDVLAFGSESRGLPTTLLESDAQQALRIPMRAGLRSLNLASSVAVGVYEAMRQIRQRGGGEHLA